MRLAVLVPVKRFTAAKGRLTGVLADSERARLAEWMASGVLEVVAEIPTFVACDDDDVAAWATPHGRARDLGRRARPQRRGRRRRRAHIAATGYDHVLVSHADLALPGALLDVAREGCVTLVPDRRHDGTNVMSFPAAHPLRAAYGGGSFARHLQQALTMATVACRGPRRSSTCPSISTPHEISPTP